MKNWFETNKKCMKSGLLLSPFLFCIVGLGWGMYLLCLEIGIAKFAILLAFVIVFCVLYLYCFFSGLNLAESCWKEKKERKLSGQGVKNTAMILFTIAFFAFSASPAFAEEKETPIGYPWSTWGGVTQYISGPEKGLKLDGYIEQGIDWTRFRLGKTEGILNTFAGLRFTASDEGDDYWNNKIGPWVGVKAKFPVRVDPQSWGEISLGVRAEHYNYFRSKPDNNANDIIGVAFFQWSLGGDWLQ